MDMNYRAIADLLQRGHQAGTPGGGYSFQEFGSGGVGWVIRKGMKKALWFLMIISITFANCRQKDSLRTYHIKFSPIGISDVFRDTLFIGMTDKFLPAKKITILTSITDSITLYKVISFIKENQPYKNADQKKFLGYGCFEICLYKKDHLITKYDLDKSESNRYFRMLITNLTKDRQDPNLINIIKGELLGPIE
jgi:hypothetical protein